ncbi:BolA domain-containing protein [Nannizzia gypsea CBS 118893]|uniref:BolA domain-containing protein n=1 Tax=Arthroderma gypseum (strain ATCC MYA-4604 / CBS 118893) TaxID=535722 RepID=E4V3C7_ARTGP|nr:BolA domain-containing protein [Nannizzia gypsea CBS 118893]EFR04501.1 BolA domain-containing protein [Nannizzia gypsea CBS 118893]
MSASTLTSQTPLEDAIREKVKPKSHIGEKRNGYAVTRELSPISLTIRNDSKHHAHHAPMQGNTSTETHFHVTIISSAFASKNQPARHRMVYNLLKEEMARDGGIHALQLKTRTPEEEEKAAKQ